MKCDVIAEGVVAAVKDVGLKLPLVVRLQGTNAEKAREMLPDFGGESGAVDDKPDPTNFAEARKAGKEAIDEMQTANLLGKELPERMKTIKNAAEKAEMLSASIDRPFLMEQRRWAQG